jgi:hypothetical protein
MRLMRCSVLRRCQECALKVDVAEEDREEREDEEAHILG